MSKKKPSDLSPGNPAIIAIQNHGSPLDGRGWVLQDDSLISQVDFIVNQDDRRLRGITGCRGKGWSFSELFLANKSPENHSQISEDFCYKHSDIELDFAAQLRASHGLRPPV